VGSDLKRYFSQMGARIRVIENAPDRRPRQLRRNGEAPPQLVLDIERDKAGEFFEVRKALGSRQELIVLNVKPSEKHLLLLSRQFDEEGRIRAKQKFLCGHDERHWFVAAIPENEPVSTVKGAKLALKPAEVRQQEDRLGISEKESSRRRNAAFIRQGEWFFIPVENLAVDPMHILHDEPLSRGNGGKPHWAEECYRSGGETVYVSAKYPAGISVGEFRRLSDEVRKRENFRTMQRDAAVHVRGEISHPDHATVRLSNWHRVLMNTENRSQAMRFLAFLD